MNIEHRVQFSSFQQSEDLARRLQQLYIAALIARRRQRAHQLAHARVVHVSQPR